MLEHNELTNSTSVSQDGTWQMVFLQWKTSFLAMKDVLEMAVELNVISKPRAQSIPTSAFAAVDATLTIWFGDLLFHLHRRLGGHHLTG